MFSRRGAIADRSYFFAVSPDKIVPATSERAMGAYRVSCFLSQKGNPA